MPPTPRKQHTDGQLWHWKSKGEDKGLVSVTGVGGNGTHTS